MIHRFLLSTLLVAVLAVPSLGYPIDLTASVLPAGGGRYNYSFSITNTGESGPDYGISEVLFDFGPQSGPALLTPIDGWYASSDGEYIDIYSGIPGFPSDGGSDIAPGQTIIISDVQTSSSISMIPFTISIFNESTYDTTSYSGEVFDSKFPIEVVWVPEPRALFIVGMAIGCMVLLNRKTEKAGT